MNIPGGYQTTPAHSITRRQLLQSTLTSATLSLLLLTTTPFKAIAKEETYLPPGAKQFERILGAQRRWTEIGTIVSERGDTLSDDEWENIRTYLRKIYAVGEDFEFYESGFDKEQGKKLKELVKAFRKQIKELDKPAKNKDPKEFMEIHAKVTDSISDFFRLLTANSDIPDEL